MEALVFSVPSPWCGTLRIAPIWFVSDSLLPEGSHDAPEDSNVEAYEILRIPVVTF